MPGEIMLKYRVNCFQIFCNFSQLDFIKSSDNVPKLTNICCGYCSQRLNQFQKTIIIFIQYHMSKQNSSHHFSRNSYSYTENQSWKNQRDNSYKGYYMPRQYPQHKYQGKNPGLDLTSNPRKQTEGWEIRASPESRKFLRHTTYLSKGQSLLDLSKLDLSSSYVNSNKNKVKNQHLNTLSSDSYYSSSKGSGNVYGNEKYDKLAIKVKETTEYIEKLKKIKKGFSKKGQLSKQENQQTLPSDYKAQKVMPDLNFKKKESKNQFYTPKPETNFLYNEKAKRIFSPEVQPIKVISPSYKKNLETVTIKDFIIEAKVGGGKFGTVHKAIHIKSRSIYALKKIPKSIIEQYLMIDQFILEFKIQSYLSHQNIVQVYGMFDDQKFFYLIMEYMPDGTLYSLLKKKKKLPQKQTASKIQQIAKAIVYMHSQGCVHRDLKPQNIVLCGNICKLCDFGWATVCEDERRQTYCGTFDYAAPQILEGVQYDKSVDLWCLGVMCYELLFGKAPFYNISRKQTKYNILNVETKKINFPGTVTRECRSFIESLLKKNPEQRLSFEQVLNHPFLKNVHSE